MPLLHNPFGYESVVTRTQIPTLPHQKPDAFFFFYRELLETFKVLSMDSINFSKWTNRRRSMTNPGGGRPLSTHHELLQSWGGLLSYSLELPGDQNDKKDEFPWEFGVWKSFFLLGCDRRNSYFNKV